MKIIFVITYRERRIPSRTAHRINNCPDGSLLVMDIKSGMDIGPLSFFGGSEGEVVIMPGTPFVITSMDRVELPHVNAIFYLKEVNRTSVS